MSELYSVPQIRNLLALAEELHFWDDVAHWKSELKRLGADG